MAASGTCLQVLTASNPVYALHNEPILRNSYLEATEEEKELTWARIADIFGLNKHVAAIIMSSSSSSIFNNRKKYIFVNFVKFVCKLSVGVKFPHTINSPAIFTTNEQVVANFLVTSR